MGSTLTIDQLGAMLVRFADQINESVQELTKLDSATGDGDHGTSMVRSVNAIKDTIESSKGEPLAKLLETVGWNIMCQDGGSTGPLLGSLFIGMGEGAPSDELSAAETAAMMEAGLANLQKQTKAAVGDKTMMDSLIPGIEALRAAVDSSDDLGAAFAAAAEAAENGSLATKDMVAKFGRARNLGDRVLGHIDAGSKSISYMFKAFSDAYDG